MSKLDEIFRKRLDKIRDELDTYIEFYLQLEENQSYASILKRMTKEKQSDHVLDKFLNAMRLNDDTYSDDEYVDDEVEECVSTPSPEEKQKKQAPKVPMQAPKYTPPIVGGSVPTEQLTLPEFLQKRESGREKLEEVLARKDESFSEMLLRMIDERGLKDSDVYKRANIDRRLFSKIRGDENYVPSKKTAIAFCLALQLELEEAKKLLATAGYTLSASSRFDLIIMYLIENCEYNIHFANIVLDDYGEGTLSR